MNKIEMPPARTALEPLAASQRRSGDNVNPLLEETPQ